MKITEMKLSAICNGCGDIMRDMGEWPVTFPKGTGPGNTLQCRRFACKTCRVPSPNFDKGYPVMVALIDDGEAA